MTSSTTNLTNRRTFGKAGTTVQVFSLSDFPDPVAGVITLDLAIAYQINGIVDISPNTILFNVANTVYGVDPINDVLTTTSSNPFLVGVNATAVILTLTVSSPNATALDFKNTAGNEKTSIFSSTNVIIVANKIGVFENMLNVGLFSGGSLSAPNGFSFTGTQNGAFVLNFWPVTNVTGSGILYDFGSAVFDEIGISNSNFVSTASNTYISGLASNGNINSGRQARIVHNSLSGTTPTLSGVDQTDDQWFFFNNPGIDNSKIDTIALNVSGDVVIGGDLLVQGATAFLDVDDLSVTDQYIGLSAGYETESGRTLGTFGPFLPLSTSDFVTAGAFTAGVASSSNPTVITVASATFSPAQIIQMAGTKDNENDGIYEVLSHIGTLLTLKGVGNTATIEDFTRTQLITNTSDSATIRHVTVTILRADTAGVWETGQGSTTAITYSNLVNNSQILTDNFLVRGNGLSNVDIGNIFMSSDGNDLTVPGNLTVNTNTFIVDADNTRVTIASTGADTADVIQTETTGTNAGVTHKFVGDRTPEGNVTGAGGDEYYRDSGETSGTYESLEDTTGTSWFKRAVNPPVIIEINNAAQFEEQATAGVITITSSTCFLIHATFETSTRFVINSGVTLRITAEPAVNTFSLTYSGTGTFFSGAGSVRINDLLLFANAASTLVGLTAGSFVIERSVVSGFPTLGSIANSGLFVLRFMSFVDVTTGFTLTDVNGMQISSIDHSGTGLTTPFFTYSQKKANIEMSLDVVNLRLGTGGSVLDISTDVNDLSPIVIDRVTTVTGDLFKQTAVSEVPITVIADASIANGTITAMADNSDSGTTISSTSTYFDGEVITISGTTSYNGTFRIFNVVASTSFDIQVTFVADDATGATVTERIGLTVGGGHGIVATDSIKIKDTNFYNSFDTVLIAGATLITVNGGFVTTNTGNIQRDVSLDQTDPRVKGTNNTGTNDSHSIACASVNDNSIVNGAIVNNTFTDMVFGTAGSALLASSTMEGWRLVDEINGTFECISLQPFDGYITFDFTVVSSGGVINFRFRWQKDSGSGFANLEDNVEALVAVRTDALSITKTFPLSASKGDLIKPEITRNTGTSEIVTSYASIYSTD